MIFSVETEFLFLLFPIRKVWSIGFEEDYVVDIVRPRRTNTTDDVKKPFFWKGKIRCDKIWWTLVMSGKVVEQKVFSVKDLLPLIFCHFLMLLFSLPSTISKSEILDWKFLFGALKSALFLYVNSIVNKFLSSIFYCLYLSKCIFKLISLGMQVT